MGKYYDGITPIDTEQGAGTQGESPPEMYTNRPELRGKPGVTYREDIPPVPSDADLEIYDKWKGFRKELIDTRFGGVDPDVFDPAKEATKAKEEYINQAIKAYGRHVDQKTANTVIENANKYAKDNFEQKKYKVDMAKGELEKMRGWFEADYKNKLAQEARDLLQAERLKAAEERQRERLEEQEERSREFKPTDAQRRYLAYVQSVKDDVRTGKRPPGTIPYSEDRFYRWEQESLAGGKAEITAPFKKGGKPTSLSELMGTKPTSVPTKKISRDKYNKLRAEGKTAEQAKKLLGIK